MIAAHAATAAVADAILEQPAAGANAARCSLWWRSAPPHRGRRTGFIGDYVRRASAGDGADI